MRRILVAKKFIDYKKNDKNIYCYTYQAPNTINRNNLTDKIYNTKYASIFNIENTDDIMLNLIGDDAGWTKYGVKKYLSVGDNEKVNKSWQRLTKDSYKGGSHFLNNLFKGIVGVIDRIKSVFGFTGTLPVIPENAYPIDNPIGSNTNVNPMNNSTNFNGMVEPIIEPIIEPDDKIKFAQSIISKNTTPENAEIINMEVPDIAGYLSRANDVVVRSAEVMKTSTDISSNNIIMQNNMSTATQDIIMSNEETERKMLNAIEKVGKWYVNHVATYQGNDKRNQASEKAKGYYKYLKDRWNSFTVRKTENGVPQNQKDKIKLDICASLSKWMYRLSDTREGAIPSDDQLLTFALKMDEYEVYYTDGTAVYDNYHDESQRRPLKDNNVDLQRFGADDCTGFMMATYKYATKALFKREKIKGYPDRDDLKYENIYTDLIFSHFNEFSNWMYKNAKIKVYTATDIINGGGLRPGDCLLTDGGERQGHAEFYVDENHTFGWGDVWNIYLRERRTIPYADSYAFSDDYRNYKYVLRYIG